MSPQSPPNRLSGGPPIPVLRPRLPPAQALLPYLERIDRARVYSNWGPLGAELEERLTGRLGLGKGAVTLAASGTAALSGAILAAAGPARPERPLALLPAFTFVATAIAAARCGYELLLADVGEDDMALDPGSLAERGGLGRVGVVIPVAPFGRPVPQAPWAEFRDATGIPVVIDAAASFDRVWEPGATWIGDVPACVSFHATKSFATGEGGCVVTTDASFGERVTQALNFGFFGTRESAAPSLNGKMSEYHAAVGLAELDGWAAKEAGLLAVAEGYRRSAAAAGIADGLVAAPEISAGYVVFRAADRSGAEAAEAELTRDGIDHRRWYGDGLHRHSAFAAAERHDLTVTEALAPRVVGLPLAPDLGTAEIGRVTAAIGRALDGSRSGG